METPQYIALMLYTLIMIYFANKAKTYKKWAEKWESKSKNWQNLYDLQHTANQDFKDRYIKGQGLAVDPISVDKPCEVRANTEDLSFDLAYTQTDYDEVWLDFRHEEKKAIQLLAKYEALKEETVEYRKAVGRELAFLRACVNREAADKVKYLMDQDESIENIRV